MAEILQDRVTASVTCHEFIVISAVISNTGCAGCVLQNVAMSRWFGRKSRHEMSSYEKNILSDPTSDGNVHGDNFSAEPTASPPPYRYEEFDRRLVTDRENDSETSDFTQTCPTCGGTGKLTRGKISCGVFLFTQKKKSASLNDFCSVRRPFL